MDDENKFPLKREEIVKDSQSLIDKLSSIVASKNRVEGELYDIREQLRKLYSEMRRVRRERAHVADSSVRMQYDRQLKDKQDALAGLHQKYDQILLDKRGIDDLQKALYVSTREDQEKFVGYKKMIADEITNIFEPDFQAINETAALIRSLWLAYVSLLAYLFISVGSVTADMLFFKKPIILPVLNIQLPLVGFFIVAPLLLLIQHWYFLLQLFTLTHRVKAFKHKLRAAHFVPDKARLRLYQNYTLRFHTFIVLQTIAESDTSLFSRLFSMSLRWFSWVSVVFAPVLILLLIQIVFLPYHHHWVTWLHRGVIFVDLGLLWSLWHFTSGEMHRKEYGFRAWILSHGRAIGRKCAMLVPRGILSQYVGKSDSKNTQDKMEMIANLVKKCIALLSAPTATLFILFCSWQIAVYPGETLYKWAIAFPVVTCPKNKDFEPFFKLENYPPKKVSLVEAFTNGSDYICRGFFSNIIILNDRDFSTNEEFDELNTTEDKERGEEEKVHLSYFRHYIPMHFLNGRDLRNAILVRSNLMRTDFSHTDLTGANLRKADLRRSLFKLATMRGVNLSEAKLDKANFWDTELQGANFVMAYMKTADFTMAKLEMADFRRAFLEEAIFRGADLTAASFSGVALKPEQFFGFGDIMGHRFNEVDTKYADLPESVIGRSKRAKEVKSRMELAGGLAKLACDAANAPYVARALINQLPSRNFEAQEIEFIRSRFEDSHCVGAEELTREDHKKLDDLWEESKTGLRLIE